MSGSDLNFRAAYIKKTGSMGNFRRDGGFQNISATTSSSSYRGSEPCICERSQLPAATSLPAESHFTLGRGQRVSETQCHAAWPWPLQGHRWAGPGQCPYSPQECGLDEGLLPPPHSCPTRWKTGRRGVCLDPVNGSVVQQRRMFVPPGADKGRLTGSSSVTAPGLPGPLGEFKAASRLVGTSDRLMQEAPGADHGHADASLRCVIPAWGHLHSRSLGCSIRAGMSTRPVREPVPVAFTALLTPTTQSSSREQQLSGCRGVKGEANSPRP